MWERRGDRKGIGEGEGLGAGSERQKSGLVTWDYSDNDTDSRHVVLATKDHGLPFLF